MGCGVGRAHTKGDYKIKHLVFFLTTGGSSAATMAWESALYPHLNLPTHLVEHILQPALGQGTALYVFHRTELSHQLLALL